MEITVHNLDTQLNLTQKKIFNIVRQIVDKLDMDMQSIQVIFVDDDYLRNMHEDYLNDPDYTDVMTFNLGEDTIEGEIYISLDRVKENAKKFEVSIENEICRNIIHGILHLNGYTDKKTRAKSIMKQKEEELLNHIQII
jgi:rRNA maturation RNase YbeY